MKYCLKTRFFLWKTDLIDQIRLRKGEILVYVLCLLIGVGFGIYIGVKLGEEESPYCLLASIFRLEFDPFPLLIGDFLRFLILSLLCACSYFLPFYPIYPSISLFLFGKHFGEILCVAFLSDSIVAATLFLFLLAGPILIIGGGILIESSLHANEFRLSEGGFFCKNTLFNAGKLLAYRLFLYLIILISTYLILCGAIYLFLFLV